MYPSKWKFGTKDICISPLFQSCLANWACFACAWIYLWHGDTKTWSFSRIIFALLPQEHQNGAMKLARVSSPKKRVYLPVHHIKTTMHSFHIRILSTQKGIMADRDAVKASLGGEIICICR